MECGCAIVRGRIDDRQPILRVKWIAALLDLPRELAMGTNRRRSVRRRVRQFATIVSRDRTLSLPCLMLDISSGGARLQLNETAEIPDQFDLVLSRSGTVQRYCRVVWREQHLIGVEFTNP
jgi:PilZ domain-containing protein